MGNDDDDASELDLSENDGDESLDLSEESDDEWEGGRRKRKTTRISQVNSNRRRVVRTRKLGAQGSLSNTDNESSAKDTDNEDSEDSSFGRPERKSGSSLRRKRLGGSVSGYSSRRERDAPARETRTSSRALPRKSYAEVEESEGEEEEREKKRLKVWFFL